MAALCFFDTATCDFAGKSIVFEQIADFLEGDILINHGCPFLDDYLPS